MLCLVLNDQHQFEKKRKQTNFCRSPQKIQFKRPQSAVVLILYQKTLAEVKIEEEKK